VPDSKTMTDRPLLVLVSDADDLPTRVRSDTRDVCRWVPQPETDAADIFTGDPTRPSCFEWLRTARGVTAVIELQPVARARQALAALRTVRPDAAVLLLSDEADDLDHERDGTLARAGDLRDVVRLDLDEELERLEAERRAFCLREFASGEDVVPILIHNDPDPDAVSSALGITALLGGSHQRTPIVTFAQMTRPENRRMTDLLRIRVTQITEEELRTFDRVITVDTQPRGLQRDGRPRFAVIDHHPLEDSFSAELTDVRPEYGATATIVTEYLRAAAPRRIGRSLATALLFGIRTDTDSLTRGVTAADVEAFAYLQEHADAQLSRRLQRPSYELQTARAFGAALQSASVEGDLCVAFLGSLEHDQAHVLADLADFCLAIGSITWVVAAALLGDDLVLTVRHTGNGPGAGELARVLAGDSGEGGGHATMGRAVLPIDAATGHVGSSSNEEMATRIRRMVADAMAALAGKPARPT
jgi:nanoRNase/pAp phosphatase (c-di-AMP/oligoRNAs hydrolase)